MGVIILVTNVKSNLADCHRAFENSFPTKTNRNVNIIKPENKIKPSNYLLNSSIITKKRATNKEQKLISHKHNFFSHL